MLRGLDIKNVAVIENLSVEAVIRAEVHHVFVVTMGSDTEKAMKSLENMIKENPAWSSLTAIKEGRLHVMDKTLFNLKPNARFAEAYEALYEKLVLARKSGEEKVLEKNKAIEEKYNK